MPAFAIASYVASMLVMLRKWRPLKRFCGDSALRLKCTSHVSLRLARDLVLFARVAITPSAIGSAAPLHRQDAPPSSKCIDSRGPHLTALTLEHPRTIKNAAQTSTSRAGELRKLETRSQKPLMHLANHALLRASQRPPVVQRIFIVTMALHPSYEAKRRVFSLRLRFRDSIVQLQDGLIQPHFAKVLQGRLEEDGWVHLLV
ncbi:hypothetical protein PSPO01_12529 [Paraphaeosphaeria sporulosa]